MPDLREPGAEAAAAVHACQRAWEQALAARDINTLGALLAPELVYVHSTGVRHDRGAYLRFVETGPTFLSVELNNITLHAADDLVVMGGMLGLTLQKAGEPQPQSLRSIVTQIWTRVPDSWQLLLAQATRPAEPAAS